MPAWCWDCFNEAAAYMPRKPPEQEEHHEDVQSGFNEAAAYMPRKLATEMEFVAWLIAASMRPRHICRGNAPALRRPPPRSPRFNEAAAYMPRKRRSARTGDTPCSRRFNEAAAYMPRKPERDQVVLHRAELASMRPRHICRGNAAEYGGDGRVPPWASMRPRHICRGNASCRGS